MTKLDLNQVISGVKMTKVCSVKPFSDATESKNIQVECTFDGAPLRAVFEKALAQEVIRLQNTKLRKEFDTLENNQVYKIHFAAPMKTAVDPESAMIAKLLGMNEADRMAYLMELAEKAKK